MQTLNTRGVLLSRSPIREFDEQVLFFTEDLGKCSALSFGSRSPRSTRRMHLARYDWLEIGLTKSRDGWNLKTLSLWEKNDFLEDDDKANAFLTCLKTIRDLFATEEGDPETIRQIFSWLRSVFISPNRKESPENLSLIFHLGLLVISGTYPFTGEALTEFGEKAREFLLFFYNNFGSASDFVVSVFGLALKQMDPELSRIIINKAQSTLKDSG